MIVFLRNTMEEITILLCKNNLLLIGKRPFVSCSMRTISPDILKINNSRRKYSEMNNFCYFLIFLLLPVISLQSRPLLSFLCTILLHFKCTRPHLTVLTSHMDPRNLLPGNIRDPLPDESTPSSAGHKMRLTFVIKRSDKKPQGEETLTTLVAIVALYYYRHKTAHNICHRHRRTISNQPYAPLSLPDHCEDTWNV